MDKHQEPYTADDNRRDKRRQHSGFLFLPLVIMVLVVLVACAAAFLSSEWRWSLLMMSGTMG